MAASLAAAACPGVAAAAAAAAAAAVAAVRPVGGQAAPRKTHRRAPAARHLSHLRAAACGGVAPLPPRRLALAAAPAVAATTCAAQVGRRAPDASSRRDCSREGEHSRRPVACQAGRLTSWLPI